MRKFLAALGLVLFASVASAQVSLPFPKDGRFEPISNSRVAGDTAPALVIKYFAPAGVATPTATTTVATAATSLTFVVNGAAYAGFEAPVSGALGGVIDMTDASANTLGEVVDIINSTPTTFATGYFRAVIAAGLRTDVVSTLAFVADAADSDVNSPEGEVIYWDSSVLDDEEILFAQYADARSLFGGAGSRNVPAKGAFSNTMSVVLNVYEKLTNAGTLSNFTVYGVKESYGSGGGCNSSTDCGSGSEVVRVIAEKTAGTTTAAEDFSPELPFLIGKGEKVFVRITASGADTSAWLIAINGYQYPIQ